MILSYNKELVCKKCEKGLFQLTEDNRLVCNNCEEEKEGAPWHQEKVIGVMQGPSGALYVYCCEEWLSIDQFSNDITLVMHLIFDRRNLYVVYNKNEKGEVNEWFTEYQL